jgi:dihydrofolate reductase
VTLVREDAVEYVRRLKEAEGRGICLMGGGELARSLFEADLIDEVGFNVQPVILGAGIPALHPLSRSLDLELMECRRFANGCVYVLYCVRR